MKKLILLFIFTPIFNSESQIIKNDSIQSDSLKLWTSLTKKHKYTIENTFVNDSIKTGWSHVYKQNGKCIIAYFYENGLLKAEVNYFGGKSRIETDYVFGEGFKRSIWFDRRGEKKKSFNI